ncbi:CRISPR-associated ring nuclease Csm6 [Vibrio halioticoli]|uniref:CRISPR system ring nuclease SSO2081-like domain-containing protein n=1 Tax=Vibrio halioticoli NBRC 102217 TaxID=1219072 RepID=V5FKW6_9VIBR|nr:CRISPR-associated ring nuclease Csm6 [Vibrio halioticoli]MPW36537.1 TIGR02584 family CRISPR-associated protein [Vibrio sp. B1Z05]GAD89542.1 hypothetical protein VHA01S_021_00360 [Vibrio halioticoli NBRC 102217]
MKNILVAVTGASPQVLTETIYALYYQGKTMPEEVFVITTENSKQVLVEGLFEQGYWQSLLKDYSLPNIKFDEQNIWLITDEQGNALSDAKGEDEQSIMADFITQKMADLTSDDSVSIHASIAGGRKTMAFYMGYAMSLYGREQDVLSHVFVDDDFEFVEDFFYPTPYDKHIVGRDKKKVINTRDAKVTLAEIPFVRMRKQVDPCIFNQFENYSFSKTVSALNSAASTETKVSIFTKERSIEVAGVTIKLTAKQLAVYLFILAQSGRKLTTDRYFEENLEYAAQYLDILQVLKADVRTYQSLGLEDEGCWKQGQLVNKGVGKDVIQTSRSNFHSKIKGALVTELYDKICIHSDGAKSGATYSISSDVHFYCDGITLS